MKNSILSWASATMLLFNFISLQAQTTWTVDNTPNSGAQFTDVQSAINAASNGDTIYVQQSDSPYASITVDKQLILIGRSHSITSFTTSFNGNIILDSGSSGSIIKGFRIIGLITSGNITVGSINNVTVEECNIGSINIGSGNPNVSYDGWKVSGNTISTVVAGSNVTNLIVENNALLLSGSGFIQANNPSSFLLRNNVIRLGYTGGDFLRHRASPSDIINITDCIIEIPGTILSMPSNFQMNNCLLSDYSDRTNIVMISSNATFQNQSGVITGQDPMFVAPFDQNTQPIADYNLLSTSPAIGAGINGGDIGFEAGYIFERLGNPKGIPEVKITNYGSIAPQNGTITFDIEARSH